MLFIVDVTVLETFPKKTKTSSEVVSYPSLSVAIAFRVYDWLSFVGVQLKEYGAVVLVPIKVLFT